MVPQGAKVTFNMPSQVFVYISKFKAAFVPNVKVPRQFYILAIKSLMGDKEEATSAITYWGKGTAT